MDASAVHEVAETLREAAKVLDEPIVATVKEAEESVEIETLDSQEVLSFLKFFG